MFIFRSLRHSTNISLLVLVFRPECSFRATHSYDCLRFEANSSVHKENRPEWITCINVKAVDLKRHATIFFPFIFLILQTVFFCQQCPSCHPQNEIHVVVN